MFYDLFPYRNDNDDTRYLIACSECGNFGNFSFNDPIHTSYPEVVIVGSKINSSNGEQQSNGGDGFFNNLSLGDLGNILTGAGYLANGVGTKIDAIVKRNYHGYNSKSVIRTGKYLPYNIRVSTKALQNTASTLKTAGNVAGFMSLGITTYQYFDGQISGTEALVDGFFPATAGISILYFGGKALYEYSTGNTLFDKPGGQ